MAGAKLSERKREELREIAEGWGKLLAREAFPDGPGLNMTLADMEDLAAMATQAMVQGAVETMTDDQAQALGEEAACPSCGKRCELTRKGRPVQVRGGTVSLDEPAGYCGRCRRDFFPSA